MKRLLYFAGLYAGSAAFLKAVGFFLSLWMAKALPVEEYATWGLAYALQTGLAAFGLVGIVEAVIALLKQYGSERDRSDLFVAANGVFVLTLAVSSIIATLIGALFVSRDILLLGSALVSGALLAYAALQAQIARLEEKHLWSLCFTFLVPLAGSIGSILLVVLERSVQAFFLGSAIGLAAGAVVLRALSLGYYRVTHHGAARSLILARITPYVAVAFFGWLGGYGNNFIVNAMFQAPEVARFTFALALSSVMQLVASALNQVWSPRFFQMTHSQPFDLVERRNRQFYALQSLALGVLCAICIAVLPPVLKVAGGNLAFYQSMRVELFLVLAAYIVLSPWWHCHNYFLAYDKGANIMGIVLLTSVVGIVAWVALMWALGPMGIYAGFFVQMLLRTLGIVYFAKGSWPVRIGWEGVGAGLLVALGGLWVSGA